ncbi:MAG: hypothetical protein ABFS17_02640 [Chloroflexota bacterium]
MKTKPITKILTAAIITAVLFTTIPSTHTVFADEADQPQPAPRPRLPRTYQRNILEQEPAPPIYEARVIRIPEEHILQSFFSEADQVTISENECFDLVTGNVVTAADPNASFCYVAGLQKILWAKGGLVWGGWGASEMDRGDCMENTAQPEDDYFYLDDSILLGYRSFKITRDGDCYYGWIRVTYFNPNQVTFDYLTYAP